MSNAVCICIIASNGNWNRFFPTELPSLETNELVVDEFDSEGRDA